MATLTSTGRFAAGESCANNDVLYGPYATIAAAHEALLNAEQNVIGRTVGVQIGNAIEEYWYQGGIEQTNLVKKGRSHPYISLERLREHLYRVTFNSIPEDDGGRAPVVGGCSAFVKDGKLFRNFDFKYDDAASFIVRTRDFEGMAMMTGLDDATMDDEMIAQLPYHMVDGRNNDGIMVSVHLLFNDWEYTGAGDKSIPMMRLPYEVLTRVKSMDTIATDLADVLGNLEVTASMGDYLLQCLVTDGTTTYAIVPPTSDNQSYTLVEATSYPKMTNFLYVARAEVSRQDMDMQNRPTGVERFNAMPCDLEDLRFTKAYENTDRLSEFIGIDGTTKASTDEELTAIYEEARAEYLVRQRDGATWQTMHSVVYDSRGIKYLYVQENWKDNCVNRTVVFESGEGDGSVVQIGPESSQIEAPCSAKGVGAIATGIDTSANSDYSHAEGMSAMTVDSDLHPGWDDGVAAHAEGNRTTAAGRASHAEGDNTVTNNVGEHAEGRYNMSHFATDEWGNAGNTVHSVGIGKESPDLHFENSKNAFEIMQNGDIYMIGAGGYDGTNPGEAKPVQETLEGKIDYPESAGTEGQVLTLDENGNPIWEDPKGGTSFEDLGYSPFSETEPYAAGDVVIYGGSLYKFTASHTGAWTGTDATPTSVEELVKEKADAIKVLTREAQNLTDAEKAQVMANLGITAEVGSLDGAVLYDAAQTLTDEQKQTARDNIGAGFNKHVIPGKNPEFAPYIKELYITDKLYHGSASIKNYSLGTKKTYVNSLEGVRAGVYGRSEVIPTENNVVYPIKIYQTTDATLYPIGTIVAYVVFSDVQGFQSLSTTEAPLNINREYCENIFNSPTIAEYLKLNPIQEDVTELQEDVTELQEDVTELQEDVTELVGVESATKDVTANVVATYSDTLISEAIPSGSTINSVTGLEGENPRLIFRDSNHNNVLDTRLEDLPKTISGADVVYLRSSGTGLATINITTPKINGRIDVIEEELSELIADKLKIVIPDVVNAIVGTELNLWNDAISLSIDKGLSSPINYGVLWSCNKGLVTDRCFRFTPSASDVGQVQCNCTIYSTSTRKPIATKTFTINVMPKNAVENSANVVLLSASFGKSIAEQLFANLHDSNLYAGAIPNMVGTRSTIVGSDTIHYEARGGYTWRHYATANAIFAYRMNVSGITSAGIGSKYSITIGSATTEVTILENNTDSGDGNLLVEAAYGAKIQNFPATGTLTLVSGAGDDSISFTEGTEETGNPFWDTENEQVSLSVYKQNVGLQPTDKIDAFICCLGGNEAGANTPTDTIKQYIETMYNAFVADNPDCKMILDVHASAGNDVNGEGFNYGASHDHLKYLENIYKYRLLCLEMAESGDYPNIVLSSAGLEVDRYYGYNLVSRAISARVSQTEKVHNNYIHPSTSGYQQIADSYIADISNALSV